MSDEIQADPAAAPQEDTATPEVTDTPEEATPAPAPVAPEIVPQDEPSILPEEEITPDEDGAPMIGSSPSAMSWGDSGLTAFTPFRNQ